MWRGFVLVAFLHSGIYSIRVEGPAGSGPTGGSEVWLGPLAAQRGFLSVLPWPVRLSTVWGAGSRRHLCLRRWLPRALPQPGGSVRCWLGHWPLGGGTWWQEKALGGAEGAAFPLMLLPHCLGAVLGPDARRGEFHRKSESKATSCCLGVASSESCLRVLPLPAWLLWASVSPRAAGGGCPAHRGPWVQGQAHRVYRLPLLPEARVTA